MVAHEIGPTTYFWPDFESLSRDRDPKERQLLELKCDGIAVLTVVALGLEVVGPFMRGFRKWGCLTRGWVQRRASRVPHPARASRVHGWLLAKRF